MKADFGYAEEEKLGKPYDLKLLGRLYPFARPHRKFFLLAVVMVMAITVLELVIPYITKLAVDRYIVPQTVGHRAEPEGERRDTARFLTVDMGRREAAEIVRKYPEHFEIEEETARIPYTELAKLDRRDLSRLRSGDLSGIARLALFLLAVIALSFIFNFIQVMLMEYAGQMLMHDLRMKLYSHIQSLPVSFFNRNPVGRLVTRVTNDIQNMYELFTSVLTFIFKDFFLLLGIAVLLMGIDLKLALVSFSVLPFVLWASFIFADRAREAFRILRVKAAELNTRFSETIGGIKVLQLFRQEGNNYERFRRVNHENYQAGMRQIQVFAVFMPIIELLASVAIAIVIYFGGRGVLSRSISLGDLVAFISYMRMFFRPIRDLAEKYNIMQNAMASAERIFLIFDTPGAIREGSAETPDPAFFEKIRTVSFENVRFGYTEGEMVLNEVSFQVPAGSAVAVVGPTGAGKTSLINLLLRFHDPCGGSVKINGRDVREWPLHQLRSKMALVTQDPYLFSGTVRENIFQGMENPSDRQIEAVLAASNCASFLDRLPEGLSTVLTEGGGAISSGERQLLSIARAFARDPDLIILDEATSYIDSQTEARIQEALWNLMRDRTAILVAHRLSTARGAGRILVLHRGRIIESGDHESLMNRQGFYFRLNQLQIQNPAVG